VSDALLDEVRAALPELPQDTSRRFEAEYGLPAYDARLLTSSYDIAKYFENATRHLMKMNPAKWQDPTGIDARGMYGNTIAKAVNGLLASRLNSEGIEIGQSQVSPVQLAFLHARVIDNTITSKIAREIFAAIWNEAVIGADGAIVDRIIEQRGLKQVSDAGAIEKIVDEVLSANQRQVADFRAGKEKAFNSLVGQVMKASQGKANPAQVNDILKRKLTG